MATAETTLLAPSSLPGAFPARQKVLFVGDSELRTARVLPRYRRHQKLRRQRQTDSEKERESETSEPLQRSNAGTADDASGADENSPQETKPLLIRDVTNVSDVSGDCPSTPGLVDRSAKLNGSPANVAVSVEEEEAAAVWSTKVWEKWRKLNSRLALRRRVTERLGRSEWWSTRHNRRFGRDVTETPTALPHKPNTLDPKSFPDNDNLSTDVLGCF